MNNPTNIPWLIPPRCRGDIENLQKVLESGFAQGGGSFSKLCELFLENATRAHRALLTHSGTAALEMGALLASVGPGDEVIMPSFTFSSTANAFVLRGATVRFVDIRPDTLNMDETLLEAAISPKTKAICPVHYAGVACEMDAILQIAKKHKLFVVEDAAQGICAAYKARPLGTLGDVGVLSFHQTKNVCSGEGGAILVNRVDLCDRAEWIREKGTNRQQFLNGEVDKYTWVDVGSSFLPSELIAAVLITQLDAAQKLCERRVFLWNMYHKGLSSVVRTAKVPAHCTHNGHIFYVICEDEKEKERLKNALKAKGIGSATHFVPLHNAPFGLKLNPKQEPLPHTESIAKRLLRLPLYDRLTEQQCLEVIQAVRSILGSFVIPR